MSDQSNGEIRLIAEDKDGYVPEENTRIVTQEQLLRYLMPGLIANFPLRSDSPYANGGTGGTGGTGGGTVPATGEQALAVDPVAGAENTKRTGSTLSGVDPTLAWRAVLPFVLPAGQEGSMIFTIAAQNVSSGALIGDTSKNLPQGKTYGNAHAISQDYGQIQVTVAGAGTNYAAPLVVSMKVRAHYRTDGTTSYDYLNASGVWVPVISEPRAAGDIQAKAAGGAGESLAGISFVGFIAAP